MRQPPALLFTPIPDYFEGNSDHDSVVQKYLPSFQRVKIGQHQHRLVVGKIRTNKLVTFFHGETLYLLLCPALLFSVSAPRGKTSPTRMALTSCWAPGGQWHGGQAVAISGGGSRAGLPVLQVRRQPCGNPPELRGSEDICSERFSPRSGRQG